MENEMPNSICDEDYGEPLSEEDIASYSPKQLMDLYNNALETIGTLQDICQYMEDENESLEREKASLNKELLNAEEARRGTTLDLEKIAFALQVLLDNAEPIESEEKQQERDIRRLMAMLVEWEIPVPKDLARRYIPVEDDVHPGDLPFHWSST